MRLGSMLNRVPSGEIFCLEMDLSSLTYFNWSLTFWFLCNMTCWTSFVLFILTESKREVSMRMMGQPSGHAVTGKKLF